jgi:hypothetical protein
MAMVSLASSRHLKVFSKFYFLLAHSHKDSSMVCPHPAPFHGLFEISWNILNTHTACKLSP